MIAYGKLWTMLYERGMKRTDLKKVISSATLAKLGKNEPVSITVIEKICDFLECQPGDIMENVSKEDVLKAAEVMEAKISEMMTLLEVHTGMNRDMIIESFEKEMPAFIESMRSGKIDLFPDLEREDKE